MRTFHISTLGCKVNQYESEQIATLLRSRGLRQVEEPDQADLRVVNTCSVTIQAASKSRQTVRQVVRLPVLNGSRDGVPAAGTDLPPQRVIVTGCWATSDRDSASRLSGVSAVLTHHDDVARQLDDLLSQWQSEDQQPPNSLSEPNPFTSKPAPEPVGDNGWMIQARTPDASLVLINKSSSAGSIKKIPAEISQFRGTTALPLLDARQQGHQRAFLKVQDGCDAHCTYCIIPKLRPRLWSKPLEETVEEARRLVDAGHVELVLTGIFLGAYGQQTALRRRQQRGAGAPLADLIQALCTRVPGLRRVRLSSLEPGDLSEELLRCLQSHPQVVPHFHLPLQSGSDALLRRMNRQYTRDDFLRMVDRVRQAFDRPALTTDIIVGFPGETPDEFARTVEVVEYSQFIHVHAFSFSPRPGTAAARWQKDFVQGPVVNERIDVLRARAASQGLAFRRQFVGATVELLVERPEESSPLASRVRHGRSERYFPVHFEGPTTRPGDCVRVTIDRVTPHRTLGTLAGVPVPLPV